MKKMNVRFIMLGICAAAFVAVHATPVAAQQPTFRAEKWQFSVPINFTFSKSFEGQGGSTVDIQNDVGWGIGFGYNFNDRFMLGFGASWVSASYDANVLYDDNGDGTSDGTARIAGRLDASSLQAVGQFNLMDRRFTPFIRGNLGSSYTDSNIPSAPPQGTCWWDPWWGYVCGTWQPTYDSWSFSFGGSAGLRAEMGRSFFLEGSFNLLWVDFSSATPSFSAIQLNIGWLF